MAYTINQGYREDHGLDRVQRGLLIGLPAIILLLSFGAIRHHNPIGNSGAQSAKLIPIVSSLSNGSTKPGSSDNGGSSGANSSATTSASAGTTGGSAQTSGSLATTGSGGSTTSSGSTLVGGRGGGPISGTTGGTGTTTPTTFPCVDATTGVTVTCTYQTCTPPLSLATGQKAYLTTTGTCIVVN